MKEREKDEISALIRSCDGEVHKRKLLQEHYQQIKDIVAGIIDVNDDSVLQELSQARQNDKKRFKSE